jgi:hypothetical protein
MTVVQKTNQLLDRIHSALKNGKPVAAADVSAMQVVRTRADYFGFTDADLSFFTRAYDVAYDNADRTVDSLSRRCDQLSRDNIRIQRDLQNPPKAERPRLLAIRNQIADQRRTACAALNAATAERRVAMDMVAILATATAARGGYAVMEITMAPATMAQAA